MRRNWTATEEMWDPVCSNIARPFEAISTKHIQHDSTIKSQNQENEYSVKKIIRLSSFSIHLIKFLYNMLNEDVLMAVSIGVNHCGTHEATRWWNVFGFDRDHNLSSWSFWLVNGASIPALLLIVVILETTTQVNSLDTGRVSSEILSRFVQITRLFFLLLVFYEQICYTPESLYTFS